MIIFKDKKTIKNKHRKIAVYIASLLCLLSFLLLVHVGYEYISSKTDEIILKEAKEDAQQKADYAIKDIHDDLNLYELPYRRNCKRSEFREIEKRFHAQRAPSG